MQKFIIKSTDMYSEKTFEKVLGSKEIKNNYILYKYESKLGKCEIIKTEDSINIRRFGESETYLEIFLNKYSDFIYKTDLLNKVFKVYGTKIFYDKDKRTLNFSYKIFEDKILLNEIEIFIREF